MTPRRFAAAYPIALRHYGDPMESVAPATESVAGDGNPQAQQALSIAASLASEFTSSDPEVLRAQIKNLKAFRARRPGLTNLINLRIRKLQGKLAAAQREEGETTQWRQLGQAGIGVGVLVGFGILGLLIAQTRKTIKTTP